MTDPQTCVQIEDEGLVRRITLHDPKRRNALSTRLLGDFIQALESGSSAGIRVVIVRTEPVAGVWSAGHDIDELPVGDRDPLMWDNPIEALLRAIRDLPFPVIAAIDGSVWGAACDLAFTCDLIVATLESSFAITPTRLGIPYNSAGVAHFLSALPVHIAKEMFFTADPISAERAFDSGAVNRLVDDRAAMDQVAGELAHRIAERAPLAISAIKAEIGALTDARALTSDQFERLNALRTRAWTSEDYREGLSAFHERRTPRFEGR